MEDRITSTTAVKTPDEPAARRQVPWRSLAIVAPFLLVFILSSVLAPNFFTFNNITNVLDRQAGTLIIAAAVTYVLIAGGFDLSVGATYVFAQIICGSLVMRAAGEGGAALGIIVAVLAGLAIGLLNGLIVVKLKINPLIATLAMSFVILGVMKIVAAAGRAGVGQIRVDVPQFRWLATLEPLWIDLPIWIALVVLVILAVVLWRTTYGRYIYAAGGNAEAARLAGIRVGLVKMSTFAIAGAAAGVAGAIDLARTASVPDGDGPATTMTFIVLAGVVVGGTSILGGEGAIWRTILGVLFIAMIYNGFTLMGLDTLYQQIALGLIILVAVGFDAWSRYRRR